MTYAVALRLEHGSRLRGERGTNAGIENIAQYRKLQLWCIEAIASSCSWVGNLALT